MIWPGNQDGRRKAMLSYATETTKENSLQTKQEQQETIIDRAVDLKGMQNETGTGQVGDRIGRGEIRDQIIYAACVTVPDGKDKEAWP